MVKKMKSISYKKYLVHLIIEAAMLVIIVLLFSLLVSRVLRENESYILQDSISIIVAIASSILASILLPKAVQREAFCELEDNIVDKMKDIIDINKFTSPAYVYSDTKVPHPEFNEKLNKSISKSKKYIYFGDRAKYLTERLGTQIHGNNNRLSIIVLLADVREKDLFEARAEIYMQRKQALCRERVAQKKLMQMSPEEIINEEKLNVLRSLYALGKLQDEYNIQVYLHREIPFIRFEITDNLFVLSFLTQLSTGKDFPYTLVYENDNIFRLNFSDYVQEVIQRSSPMSREDLQMDKIIEMGKKAKIAGCNEKEIVKHYNEKVKS